MGYGYGLELRARIVESYESGEGSVRETAERFKVSASTVQSYLKLKRTTGALDPYPVGGGGTPLIGEHQLEKVREVVEAYPDATTEELADEVARRGIAAVSRPTMGRVLQRLDMTRKKNAACERTRHSARAEGTKEVPAEGQEAAREAVHLRR